MDTSRSDCEKQARDEWLGDVVSTIELDPWGGNTYRNNNAAFQPQQFNGYIRDEIAADDAMFRRYNRWWSRFDQPDAYGGSYNLTNPQSFNRYPYARNDSANLVDSMGLDPQDPPATTQIDPNSGERVAVPGINAGTVTIYGSQSSGPIMGNSILGGDSHTTARGPSKHVHRRRRAGGSIRNR